MALTMPRASQINFDLTNITDPIIRLNSGESGSADKDTGIVLERGSDTNVALLYDESANQFALVNTNEDGTTSGNVTIASYAPIKISNLLIADDGNIGSASDTDAIAIASGGIVTFSQAPALGTNKITGVGDPTASQDAATKAYVDSQISSAVTTTGTATLTNKTINGPDNTLTNIANSSLSNSAITVARQGGNSTAISLGGTITFNNVTNETTVGEDSGTITIGLPATVQLTTGLTVGGDTATTNTATQTLTNKTLTSPTVTTAITLNAQADLKFADADSSHYVAFQAPNTVASNVLWTLPGADGTEDQVLSTNGSGTLAWADAGSGGSSSGSSFPNSTVSTMPGSAGDYDLRKNTAQDTAETPFEAGSSDAFGVNLGTVYSMMDPAGTSTTVDLGAFT